MTKKKVMLNQQLKMLLDTAVDIRGGMINDDVLLDGKSTQSSCPKFLQRHLNFCRRKVSPKSHWPMGG
jgi:hypothetical protein